MTRKRISHSGTCSAVMRARRIGASAIPEVRAAIEEGLLTIYRAGEIARLPADQQAVALTQWAARSEYRTQGQSIAAKAIRAYLRGHARVDLDRVAAAIRAAVAMRHQA
jgi:hypothetical protein